MKNYSTAKSGFMRTDRSSSLAGTHGITRKTPARASKQGLGLNPNLSMENEYVQNLLKQIHFLNMQVKLFKEKNEENKGMGIMGLIGKDSKPVVQHAIISNQKFTDMKQKLIHSINQLQAENLRLEDQNSALQSQKEYLGSSFKDFSQKLNKKKQLGQKQLAQLKIKLNNDRTRRKQLQYELNKLQAQANQTQKTYDKLVEEKQLKQLNDRITVQKFTKQRKSQMQEHEQRVRQIQELEGNIKRKKDLMQNDHKYVQLQQEKTQLLQKIKVSEKQLFDLQYSVQEFQVRLQLAKKVKLNNLAQRKERLAQLDKAKIKLQATQKSFKDKVDFQIKKRETVSPELMAVRMISLRADDQLKKLREKQAVAQQNYRKYAAQQALSQKAISLYKQLNAKLDAQLKQLHALNNTTSTSAGQSTALNQSLQSNFLKSSDDRKQTVMRITGLEQQVAYLRAKCQFLEKNVNLDDDMKGVKIEQLRQMVQNNIQVNQTIQELMSKWQQMRKFSKGY